MLARHFVEKNPYLYVEGRGEDYYKLSSRNPGRQDRCKILIILSLGQVRLYLVLGCGHIIC